MRKVLLSNVSNRLTDETDETHPHSSTFADDIFVGEPDYDFEDDTVRKTSIGLGTVVAVFIAVTFVVLIVMKLKKTDSGKDADIITFKLY